MSSKGFDLMAVAEGGDAKLGKGLSDLRSGSSLNKGLLAQFENASEPASPKSPGGAPAAAPKRLSGDFTKQFETGASAPAPVPKPALPSRASTKESWMFPPKQPSVVDVKAGDKVPDEILEGNSPRLSDNVFKRGDSLKAVKSPEEEAPAGPKKLSSERMSSLKNMLQDEPTPEKEAPKKDASARLSRSSLSANPLVKAAEEEAKAKEEEAKKKEKRVSRSSFVADNPVAKAAEEEAKAKKKEEAKRQSETKKAEARKSETDKPAAAPPAAAPAPAPVELTREASKKAAPAIIEKVKSLEVAAAPAESTTKSSAAVEEVKVEVKKEEVPKADAGCSCVIS